MLILSIDPGTTQSAVLLWDTVKCEILWTCGKHGEKWAMPNEELNSKENGLAAIYEADIFAIEMVEGMDMVVGKETFRTAYWVGRFAERFLRIGEVLEVTRREEKLRICGTCRANDAMIRKSLIAQYGGPGSKKFPGVTYALRGDLWAAFAVAITAEQILKEKEMNHGKR